MRSAEKQTARIGVVAGKGKAMRHVLVIEDEYLMAQCVADMVLFAGASSVDIADSETAAIEAASRRQPCVIVCDVDLKQGGRGPKAVADIHSLCGIIPTIFVTGDPNDEQACALATAVVSKPVTPHSLASTFRRIADTMPQLPEAVYTGCEAGGGSRTI